LISSEAYRNLLKPLHSEIAKFCHSNGMKLFMHSCGNIEAFIPDFIEAGIDVIQPLQANTGMDVVKLKKRFGDSIVFFGNVSAKILSEGKEAIEEEICCKVGNAKKGGGYIYHSDHSVPDNVPLGDYEHLIRMLDKYGRYSENFD
jgi:uroporphyrinogen decarboxylase